MSLQPGMNPFEASSMEDDRKRLERTMAARKFRQGMQDQDDRNRLDRTMAAMKFRENMAQGIPNTGGFDASDLMARPEMAQKSTRDQAEKVSEPYREANMMAAEKTNPMNAESQNPGKIFLMRFIGK